MSPVIYSCCLCGQCVRDGHRLVVCSACSLSLTMSYETAVDILRIHAVRPSRIEDRPTDRELAIAVATVNKPTERECKELKRCADIVRRQIKSGVKYGSDPCTQAELEEVLRAIESLEGDEYKREQEIRKEQRDAIEHFWKWVEEYRLADERHLNTCKQFIGSVVTQYTVDAKQRRFDLLTAGIDAIRALYCDCGDIV